MRYFAAGLIGGTALWSAAMHEWGGAALFGGLSLTLLALNAALDRATTSGGAS